MSGIQEQITASPAELRLRINGLRQEILSIEDKHSRMSQTLQLKKNALNRMLALLGNDAPQSVVKTDCRF